MNSNSVTPREDTKYDDQQLNTISNHVMDVRDVTVNSEEKGGAKAQQRDVIANEHDKSIQALKQFSKMLCISVAYASNIGGLATLTGTPTNLLVAEFANKWVKSISCLPLRLNWNSTLTLVSPRH